MPSKKNKYEEIEELIIKNKIPLLTNYEPFEDMKNNHKKLPNDIIQKYYFLKELVSNRNKLEQEITRLQNEKPNVMAKIIYVSQKINEDEDTFNEEELEKLRERIYEINLKLDENFKIIEEVTVDIKETNIELLRSVVKYSYDTISKDGDNLSDIEKLVTKLRKKLDELRVEKEELEEEMNGLYRFIHGMVGYKDVEKLDNKYLK